MALHRTVFVLPRLALFLFGLAAFALSTARAQDDRTPKLAPAPPQPKSFETKTARGEPVDIPLGIFGARRDRLTFLIRKPPNAGNLSEPKNDTFDSAIVRFFPPTDLAVKRASFTYAVKSAEGVSAPAEVTIEIVDAPAELRVPGNLDFPALLLGERKVETIGLANSGGERCEGEARVGSPFAIEGSSHYRIEPKGKAVLRIVFTPITAGTFETDVSFSSHPNSHTTVKGNARPPIEINPSVLTLQIEPLTGVRSGFVSIQNHTVVDQAIKVRATDRLKVVGAIELEPGDKKIISVSTLKEDPAALAEMVQFVGNDAEASLEVVAEPVPAKIRVSSQALMLRPNAQRSAWTGMIELQNRGGVPGTVQITGAAGLRTDESELAVQPGETKQVRVSLMKLKQREFRGALSIKTASGTQLVAVSAEFPTPSTPARPAQSQRSRYHENGKSESRRRTPESTLNDFDPGAMAPDLQTRLVKISPHGVTLEWPAPETPVEYHAEIRQLTLRNGKLETSWAIHPEFEFALAQGHVQGTLRALNPGKIYTAQIVTASGSNAGRVAARKTFQTERAGSRWNWITWPRALLALAMVLVGGVIGQRLRQRTRSL